MHALGEYHYACVLPRVPGMYCVIIRHTSPWSVGLGEGSPYKASGEEIGSLADVCNQKKKAAKIVGVRSKTMVFLYIFIVLLHVVLMTIGFKC